MSVRLLKHDHFGSITLIDVAGEPTRIRRDTRVASPGLRWLARLAARREAKALRLLNGLTGVPALLHFDGRTLERSYIGGLPMHEAKPCDPCWFAAAHRLLKAMRARGVVHNDLAKEANWLVTTRGEPAVLDFQLAWATRRRGPLFRLLCRENLRHLLKHKRSYCPAALTPTERRVLARKSWIANAWRASGKRVYILIARRLLGWEDNEARGRRGTAAQAAARSDTLAPPGNNSDRP